MKSSISSSRLLDDSVAKHSKRALLRWTLPYFFESCGDPNSARLNTFSILVRNNSNLCAVNDCRGLKMVYRLAYPSIIQYNTDLEGA